MTTESTNDALREGQEEQVEVRSGTVLRARREEIELHTADGLTLVGELALPPERDPVATLVTLHPLPTHGGFMDSHVLKKASYRLPALADIAVLRFNTRGTTSPRGTSGGTFDEARSERYDVAAAIEYAEFHDLPHRVAARVVLRHRPGAHVRARPGRGGRDPAQPAAALQPRDEHLQRVGRRRQAARGARAGARRLPAPRRGGASVSRAVPQARVVGVEGGRHLWVGETATCAARSTRSSPWWPRPRAAAAHGARLPGRGRRRRTPTKTRGPAGHTETETLPPRRG